MFILFICGQKNVMFLQVCRNFKFYLFKMSKLNEHSIQKIQTDKLFPDMHGLGRGFQSLDFMKLLNLIDNII